MRSVLIALCIHLLSTMASFSQVAPRRLGVGISGVVAVPVYNMDYSTTGAGLEAKVFYGILNNLTAMASAGFTGLPGKGSYPSTAIIPIRAGLRYFPLSRLYFSATAGLGIYTILKTSANHVSYELGGGFSIKPRFDVGLQYEGFSNKHSSFGYVACKFTYVLKH